MILMHGGKKISHEYDDPTFEEDEDDEMSSSEDRIEDMFGNQNDDHNDPDAMNEDENADEEEVAENDEDPDEMHVDDDHDSHDHVEGSEIKIASITDAQTGEDIPFDIEMHDTPPFAANKTSQENSTSSTGNNTLSTAQLLEIQGELNNHHTSLTMMERKIRHG